MHLATTTERMSSCVPFFRPRDVSTSSATVGSCTSQAYPKPEPSEVFRDQKLILGCGNTSVGLVRAI